MPNRKRKVNQSAVSPDTKNQKKAKPQDSQDDAVDPSSMKASYANNNNDNAAHAPIARVQGKAPAFQADAVINGDFKTITLDDYKGKYVILMFYPLDFTFVCPTEIIGTLDAGEILILTAFSDRVQDFKDNNCEVLALSVDSKYTHLAWINTPRKQGGLGDLKIPLVSDITKQISRDYGVLLEDEGISLRGLFIINEHGVIRHIGINDLPVGRSVDEALRLVQAFQYTDKFGEVCPSGWKPGDPTMHADPEKAKEYFHKVFTD